MHLRKCEKLPQTNHKLADLQLQNTSCSFAELSVNLRCPALEKTNMQWLDRVSCMVHFDYFSSQAWFFGTISLIFQKDSSKKEVSIHLQHVAYWLKAS